MPHLDKKGPDGYGLSSGRKLGLCDNPKESVFDLGQGMGLKRKSIKGKGLGKRLRSSNIFNNN